MEVSAAGDHLFSPTPSPSLRLELLPVGEGGTIPPLNRGEMKAQSAAVGTCPRSPPPAIGSPGHTELKVTLNLAPSHKGDCWKQQEKEGMVYFIIKDLRRNIPLLVSGGRMPITGSSVCWARTDLALQSRWPWQHDLPSGWSRGELCLIPGAAAVLVCSFGCSRPQLPSAPAGSGPPPQGPGAPCCSRYNCRGWKGQSLEFQGKMGTSRRNQRVQGVPRAKDSHGCNRSSKRTKGRHRGLPGQAD